MTHSRILVWGDPHFKRNNAEQMALICQFIDEQIDLLQPDLFVCLGDVFDTHNRCYMDPFVQAHKFFAHISQKVKVVTLVGNHDRENNQDFMSDKHFLVNLPGNVISRSTVDWNDSRIMYVPYVPPGRFHEAIEPIWHPEIKICFAHQEFRGAADNFHVSEIEEETPQNMLIISGHYHRFQVIDNLIYVGTIQHRFGDCADNALLLVNLADEITYSRIPITCIRKKIIMEYNIDEIESAQHFLDENVAQHEIRIIFNLPYGSPVNHKDPRMADIVKRATSVIFRREQAPVANSIENTGSTMPSFREVYIKSLTTAQMEILNSIIGN